MKLAVIPNLYLSFKDTSRSLNEEQLLSHRNQSGVLFQLTLILNSNIQFKLMSVITSFISLFTIVVRLIAIHSFL